MGITPVDGGITVARTDTKNVNHGWGMNLRFRCCTPAGNSKTYYPIPTSMFVSLPKKCFCSGGTAATGKACTGVGITKCTKCKLGFENPQKGCPRVKSGLKCGSAVCEYAWTGIGGTTIAALTRSKNFPNKPNVVRKLTSGTFSVRQNGNNMGALIEGFVLAPASGAYTFSTRSDDSSEVWAAKDPHVTSGLVKVAELKGCCHKVMGTTKLTWKAGSPYYIRAMVKEGGGGEYLDVGMKIGRKEYYPIPIEMFVGLKGRTCACKGGTGKTNFECKPGAALCESCPAGSDFANAAKTSCKKVKSGLKCGAAACEYDWTGITGTNVRDLTRNSRFPDKPNAMVALTDAKKNKSKRFQLVRKGDNLGAMLEGFVTAPVTGDYTFSTRSDDSSEVWAAPKPKTQSGLRKVVELRGCCRKVSGGTRLSWTKGLSYYIKALVKEGRGGEYLYVGMYAREKIRSACQDVTIGRGPVYNKRFKLRSPAYRCPRIVSRSNWLGRDRYGDKFQITHYTNGIKVERIDTKNKKAGWGMNLRFRCCTPSTRMRSYDPIPVSMFANVKKYCTCENGVANTGSACKGVGLVSCKSCKPGYEKPAAGCRAVPSGLRCGKAVCQHMWNNICGTRVKDLTSLDQYPDFPDRVSALTQGTFSSGHRGNNLGTMLEGFFAPPTSGDYSFSTRSDDSSEVWVATQPSTTSSLKKVVELNGCCRKVQGKTKIKMNKGNVYYIRAMVKEGGGGEYLQVGATVGKKEYFPIPISMFVQQRGNQCKCSGGKAAMGWQCPKSGMKKCASCPRGKVFLNDKQEACVTATSGLKCGAAACKYDWTGISGKSVRDLTSNARFPSIPSRITQLKTGKFSVRQTGANNGAMLEGFVAAPLSGWYTFITNSRDASEVWSTGTPDTQETGVVKVVESKTGGKKVTVRARLTWTAGKTYYIKAFVKHGSAKSESLDVGIKWRNRREYYPLDIRKHFVNVPASCVCPGGTVATGKACPNTGVGITVCSACNLGFALNKASSKCEPLKSGLKCGSAVCEYAWTGIGGTRVQDLTKNKRFPNKPNIVRKLTSGKFSVRQNGNNMGALIEGFVSPPSTSVYTFITRSDDSSEVWASPVPGTNKGNLVKVVELKGCCRKVYGNVKLSWEAGKAYYIRGLVKEGGGGEYLDIGMKDSNSCGKEVYPIPVSMFVNVPGPYANPQQCLGLVNNGNFDVGTTEARGYTYMTPASWTARGGVVVVKSGNRPWGGLPSADGKHFISIQGRGAFVEQSVCGLTKGQQYSLTFAMTHRPGYGNDEKAVVKINGKTVWSADAKKGLPAKFASFTVKFTASGRTAKIRFENDSPKGDKSVFLDNVKLAKFSATVKCAGDADANKQVNVEDLLLVLANYGKRTTKGNVNTQGASAGKVDVEDLLTVLANFGKTC